MLWWDDNKGSLDGSREEVVPCYRSTGVVRVPRAERKLSYPTESPAVRPAGRKISCPALLQAHVEQLTMETETVVAISGGNYLTPQYRTDGLVISAMVLVSRPPRTATGPRVTTREPDIVTQLTRGNMKERWGLTCHYRLQGRLELVVANVVPASPAAKAGMKTGDVVVQINGWKIEAMDNTQTAVSLFMAGGYRMTMGWLAGDGTTSLGRDWHTLNPL